MLFKDLIEGYDFKYLDKNLGYLEIKTIKLIDDPKDIKKIVDPARSFLIFTGKALENRGLIDFINSLSSLAVVGLQNKEALKKISFPQLVIFPQKISPASLTIGLLDRLREAQAQLIRQNEYVNRVFMEMNINQASLEEYVDFLSNIIKKDIIYYGRLDYLTYATGDFFLDPESLKDQASSTVNDYYTQVLVENHRVYGYIFVKDLPKNISEKDRLIIEYTSSMILIKIQNQIAIDNSKEIVRSDLIADLCMNNIKSKEEVIFRANIQGWELKSSGLLAVIFDIDDFKHTMVHSNKNYEDLEEEKQLIYSLIIKEMDNIPYASYYYSKSDSIIFLVNVDFKNNLADLDRFIVENIKPIHNILNNQGLSFTLTIGIGTYYDDIMETYKSYNEAIESINISRIFKEIDDVSCYKDVIIFKDLMEIMTRKGYNSIYTNLVKKIIDLDRENKTEYFKTLKSIIKNDWNLKDSSESLFIHYNTVLYRFEKIKDLLGMSLDNFYEKLIITLTVMLLEVEKHIDFNKGVFKK